MVKTAIKIVQYYFISFYCNSVSSEGDKRILLILRKSFYVRAPRYICIHRALDNEKMEGAGSLNTGTDFGGSFKVEGVNLSFDWVNPKRIMKNIVQLNIDDGGTT